jgi:predicted nucleotidyltransferase
MDEIRDRVAPIAQKYRIPRVFVFGSYARGEATDESDVDLLIDRTDMASTRWYLSGVFEDFEAALGKQVDIITTQSLDQPAAQGSRARFRDAVNRERRLVYDCARYMN